MDYPQRVSKLRKKFEGISDALIIDDPTDLFYLTGLDLSAGKLIVYPNRAKLLVDGRYTEARKRTSPFPVGEIIPSASLKIWSTTELANVKKLAFDSQKTTYKAYQSLQNIPDIELIPLDAPVEKLRMVKDDEELEILRKA